MRINWPTKKLGEICDIKTGKKDVNEGNPNGQYPFFTCSNEITYSDTYSFDTEAILIAGNGDVGSTKYYKGKFEAYQRTYVLDQFKTGNIKFFYYFISNTIKEKLLKDKSGSTMPYIRKGDIESFEVPIPPLPIQQKIVKILDIVQEAIEVQDKIIELTKELKKSVMADLFKYGAPSFRKGRKLKKTEIGEIPEDWEVVRLGGVIVNTISGDWGEEKESNGDYILCRILRGTDFSNIERGSLDGIPVRFIKKKVFEKLRLEQGDILIELSGGSKDQPTGRIFIWRNNLNKGDENIVYSNFVKKLKLDNSKIVPEYFYRYWQYLYLLGRTKKYERRTTNIRNFKYNDFLKNEGVPLPPLPEQQEIAEILQTIDEKIELEKKKKELYEELFKVMLNKLMSGEINVEKINLD